METKTAFCFALRSPFTIFGSKSPKIGCGSAKSPSKLNFLRSPFTIFATQLYITMPEYLNLNYINLFFGGILLALSVVLFMIPIPGTARWRNFRTGRGTLAAAYIVLGLLMMVNGTMGGDSSACSGMITLIISCFQALLYTKICVLFVKPHSMSGLQYRGLLAASAAYSLGLVAAHAMNAAAFRWMFGIGIGLYTMLLAYCCMVFRKNYAEAVRHMEYIYDEDMDYRLRWVKRCFYSALLVGVMAWFMAVWYESELLNTLGIIVYSIYYLCMIGYFMRYVSNYSFILKADDNETEKPAATTAQPEPPAERETPAPTTKKNDHELETRLAEWIKEKKFRNNEKVMGDIVEELHTTRQVLHEYMVRTKGMTFRTWRNRLRIEDAKQLLQAGDIPISEIYLTVGYTDRSNFHRQFTEVTGLTPLEYRKKNKKDF